MSTRNLTVCLALLLTASITGVAQAQVPVEAPPPPPVSEPHVSQINGYPVAVGHRGEYLYSYPRLNLSTNPFGFIVGLYGASGSYALHPNFAVRGDISYFNATGTDETGLELGVGLPIYFRHMYRGWFLEPGFIVRRIQSDDFAFDTTTFGPQVLGGYHWLWDSGLNIAVAFGMGRNWSTSDSDDSDFDDEEIFPNGYLRFGYAF